MKAFIAIFSLSAACLAPAQTIVCPPDAPANVKLAHIRCALAQSEAGELARLHADACRWLLATVNRPGGLAMLVNMENHPGWGPSHVRLQAFKSTRPINLNEFQLFETQ